MDRIRIAIADDEAMVLDGLTALVSSLSDPYEIVGTADNGEDMLALLTSKKADLLLTDIRMPCMDGIRLTTELEKFPNPPCVIIVSAYDDRRYLQYAIRSPIVYDYVMKPFHQEEFSELLRAAAHFIIQKRADAAAHTPCTISIEDWVARILKSVQGGDSQDAIAQMRAAWEQLSTGKQQSECIHIASEIMMKITWGINIGTERQMAVLRLYNGIRELENCRTPMEIRECLEGYLRAACCDPNKKSRITALVSSCLQLINNNIADKNFGIAQAAEMLDVTPNYLSARFSRDMGLNFTKYLTMLRIEKAKQYLQTTNLRIYQISDLVGYEDSGYFVRVFKESVGMRPGEYRNIVNASNTSAIE